MSRFNNTKKIRYLDKEILARWENYSWLVVKPNEDDIQTLKILSQFAGDSRTIANNLYGDHNLYWVLNSFNYKWYNDYGAMNVFAWPSAGQVVYYPVRSIIVTSIG